MCSHRGQTLIAMYMIVLVLSILGGSFLIRGTTIDQHGRIERFNTAARYLAQAGAEDAIATFVNAIGSYQIAANPTCYPDTNGDGVCVPDVATQTDVLVTTLCAQSGPCPNSPFSAGSTPRAFSWVTAVEPTERTITEGDGTITYLRNYEVVTQASHPDSPTQTVRLHQVVTRRLVPTFQHAVFYNDDLEILPGANMTLSGRVHSNSNMYLDAYTGKTLTIDTEYVHAAGNIYNFRKDTGAPYAGDVAIKKAGTSPAEFELLLPGQDSTSPTWATDAITRWNGTVQSGVHGVTQLAVPAVGSTAPSGPNPYYATNADVKITDTTIQKKSGGSYVDVVECTPAAAAVTPATCVPIGTLTTTPTGSSDPNRFYDNRENKIAKMTNIDVKRLGGYYDANADGVLDPPGTSGNPYVSQLPSNGLLYATRSDATGSQLPAIRLVNGTVVNRTSGLAIVSNDPVYVQGDFNTVSKKPVAIIADALNLLSNNWSDNKSYQSISNRTATATTVNSAFVAGIKTTTSSNYNGGLENYPRLQENWTSKTLAIRGSFVALWNSQIATGNWPGTGTVYNAPIRNWDYDTDFTTTGRLPPFTPWAVEAVRGAWWKE